METTALYIGYAILGILGMSIILFAFAMGWCAVSEGVSFVRNRKWRKRMLSQLNLETARDCAYYLLNHTSLVSNTTLYDACEYFDEKFNELKK